MLNIILSIKLFSFSLCYNLFRENFHEIWYSNNAINHNHLFHNSYASGDDIREHYHLSGDCNLQVKRV